jgi:hypothetical protein
MRTTTLVTLLGIGKVRVRASQAGNHIYQAASIDSFFCIRPVRPYIIAKGMVLSSSNLEGNQWFLDDEMIEEADTRTITVTALGKYTVQVANTDSICGPSDLSLPYEMKITSLQELRSDAWSISPNPARDFLRVRFQNGESPAQLKCTLYTHTGKVVLEKVAPAKKGEDYLLPISNLKPGLYLLQIIANKQTAWQKVVIE